LQTFFAHGDKKQHSRCPNLPAAAAASLTLAKFVIIKL